MASRSTRARASPTRSEKVVSATSWRGVKGHPMLSPSRTSVNGQQARMSALRGPASNPAGLASLYAHVCPQGQDTRGRDLPQPQSPSAARPFAWPVPSAECSQPVIGCIPTSGTGSWRRATSFVPALARRRIRRSADLHREPVPASSITGSTYASLPFLVESMKVDASGTSTSAKAGLGLFTVRAHSQAITVSLRPL